MDNTIELGKDLDTDIEEYLQPINNVFTHHFTENENEHDN